MSELPLGSDPRTAVLRRMQAALIARFGRIERPPGKRRDPVWALVQGVIGARTRTAVSNANADALLARYGSWEAVVDAPVAELAAMLKSATYRNVAAERLKACLTALIAERGSADLRHLSNLPMEEALASLESLPGVGRKIAAGVMNASTFAHSALVIDSHHLRIARRMRLVAAKADTRRAYDALMPAMPHEWSAADIDEHHLLVKRLGQTLCRPSRMECPGCPVQRDCATGRTAAAPLVIVKPSAA